MLGSGQEGEPQEYEAAFGGGVNRSVEVALFLAVEDDEVEPVLETLQRDGDGGIRTDRARGRAAAHVDAAGGGAVLDLRIAEHADELPRALSTLERGDLGADDAADQLAQRQVIPPAAAIGWREWHGPAVEWTAAPAENAGFDVHGDTVQVQGKDRYRILPLRSLPQVAVEREFRSRPEQIRAAGEVTIHLIPALMT